MSAMCVVIEEIGPDDLDPSTNWHQEDAQKIAGILARCCDRDPEGRTSARAAVRDLCEVLGADGGGIGSSTNDVAAGEIGSLAGASCLCKMLGTTN